MSSEHPVSTKPRPFQFEYRKLSDVQALDVNWFWHPYAPAGALTLLFGQGGIGKSWITCSIAADVSAGRLLPGQKLALPPQKVLMVSAEDDASYIIKPRMERLKANMDNIYVSDQTFILDERGIRGLEEAMRSVAATVVFLDPLVSYLGGKMDINKSNEARAMMGPLALAAQRTGCAVVVVHHVRKDSKGGMMQQALGSVDFGNSVRSACLVQQSKSGQKMLVHVKHNWSAQGPTLAFSLTGDTFTWEGNYYDDDSEKMPVSTKPRYQAAQFLQDQLRDGPKPSLELLEKATAYGFTQRTLNRAKIGLAHSRKVAGVWCWELDAREGLGDALVNSGNSEADRVAGVEAAGGVARPADQDELLERIGRGTGEVPRGLSDYLDHAATSTGSTPGDVPTDVAWDGDMKTALAQAQELLRRKQRGEENG